MKTVQARPRHGSARTTLDMYGHLWPDKDESTKAIVDSVIIEQGSRPTPTLRVPKTNNSLVAAGIERTS